MKVFMMAQGTDDWWAARRGIPTASAFDRIITPSKGELSKSAGKYIAELCADVLCQNPAYFTEKGHLPNSYAIQNGQSVEPEARRWLSMDANLDVTEVGFCLSDDMLIGCSPDGAVGFKMATGEAVGEFNGQPFFDATMEATCELKCPLLSTHVDYLLAGGLPVDYRPQVHGQLIVTGAAYCEFVSYARGAAPFRVRVERDSYTDRVEAALKTFVEQYRQALEKVRRR